MDSPSTRDFGPFIAFVIPGAVALTALRDVNEWVRHLTEDLMNDRASAGALAVCAVLSTGLGIILSVARSLTLDWSLRKCARPVNYCHLVGRVEEYRVVIDGVYRYYQLWGNLTIATLLMFVTTTIESRDDGTVQWPIGLAAIASGTVAWWHYRDTYTKLHTVLSHRSVRVMAASPHVVGRQTPGVRRLRSRRPPAGRS